MNEAAIGWSAGKEAHPALLRAREAGFDAATVLTMQDTCGLSKRHALTPALIAAQLATLGGAGRRLGAGAGGARTRRPRPRVFRAQLRALRAAGHAHTVFGDIDLQAHRDWLQPLCDSAGLQALFPLWGAPRAALAQEIGRRGIRARLVCVDVQQLAAAFCGAACDAALPATLPPGVCPCGEDGEVHTVVFGGPGFAAPLRLRSLGLRSVAAAPPLRPATFVFDMLEPAAE